jgi:hypothetical protein
MRILGYLFFLPPFHKVVDDNKMKKMRNIFVGIKKAERNSMVGNKKLPPRQVEIISKM